MTTEAKMEQQVTIDRYRIVPAPLTGIGWVAVQEWNHETGEYKHFTTVRCRDEAEREIVRKCSEFS